MRNQLNQEVKVIVAVVVAAVANGKRKSTKMKDMNVLQMRVNGRQNIITTMATEGIIADVEEITLVTN